MKLTKVTIRALSDGPSIGVGRAARRLETASEPTWLTNQHSLVPRRQPWSKLESKLLNRIAVAARLELEMVSRLCRAAGFLLRKSALSSKKVDESDRMGATSALIPAEHQQEISTCVRWSVDQ